MPLEWWGRRWEFVRGTSSRIPGWWFCELWDVTDDPDRVMVLDAYWPVGGELTVTPFQDGLPSEAVAWFTEAAREDLCPTNRPTLDG
jgi:hypothetical protein